jgi:hypothetical protein
MQLYPILCKEQGYHRILISTRIPDPISMATKGQLYCMAPFLGNVQNRQICRQEVDQWLLRGMAVFLIQ